MTNEPSARQLEPDPLQVVGLTIKEAAAELGISEKTVRHRIKLNQLPALKVDTPQGYQWRVYPDGLPPGLQLEPDPLPSEGDLEEDLEEDVEPDPLQVEIPALLETLRMLEARQAVIDRLHQEASEKADKIAELTGAAAHWQTRAIVAEEQARRAEDQVKLLMAPKDEPAEETPAKPEPKRSWWQRLIGG
jgi:excisionase family DNA binding protein